MEENLPKESYQMLHKVVLQTWVMDPVKLPPNAMLNAPHVKGKPIHRWEQLSRAEEERNLIQNQWLS